MPLPIFFLIPVLCIASRTDYLNRKIPNSLLLPSFLAGLLLNIVTLGREGLVLCLSGSLTGFALLIIPYLLGGIGAGDVKLLMVIGCFGGPQFVFCSFILGALLGGIISAGVSVCNSFQINNISSIPYGIPLSLGTILWIVLGYWRL